MTQTVSLHGRKIPKGQEHFYVRHYNNHFDTKQALSPWRFFVPLFQFLLRRLNITRPQRENITECIAIIQFDSR